MISSSIPRSYLSVSLIFLCLLGISLPVNAEEIGKVIMVRGDVTASSESGETRQLKRRDRVYASEVIKTGDASRIQIRFADNALLALRENSELNIHTYVYAPESADKNQVLMDLVTGGFRTLTGSIGKGNKEAYKVNTPAASIGIRGTLYDLHVETDKVYAGVWEGGISIETADTDFDLGVGAGFDFAEVSSRGEVTGLLSAPDVFTPPAQKTSSESDTTQNAVADNDQQDNGESEKQNEPQQPDQDSRQENGRSEKESTPSVGEQIAEVWQPNRNNSSKEPDTPDILAEDISSGFSPDALPNPFEKEEIEKNDELEELREEIISEIEDILNPDPDTENPILSSDQRLTELEYQQLTTGPQLALVIGGTTPVRQGVALNAERTGELFFLTDSDGATGNPPLEFEVIRRGNATDVSSSVPVPWGNQVTWGAWEGTAAEPIQRYTKSDDGQVFDPFVGRLLYMALTPASDVELQGGLMSGNFSTAAVLSAGESDFLATSNAGLGSVMDVQAQFGISVMSPGIATLDGGQMTVLVDTVSNGVADRAWVMNMADGFIAGAMVHANLTGQVSDYASEPLATNVSEATGMFGGVFLKPDSTTTIDTMAGSFEFHTTDLTEFVGGAVILQHEQPQ